MNVTERLARHLGRKPDTAAALFVAANDTVVGDVVLGPESSVVYGAVLRGETNEVRVGVETNDCANAVVHLADNFGVQIGAWCTIGHSAIVHACTIGDECLIGMGATVLDGAEIGARSLIGAHALVPMGMKVPPGSMVYGAPAKVVRPLTAEEQGALRRMAEKYLEVARGHAALIR